MTANLTYLKQRLDKHFDMEDPKVIGYLTNFAEHFDRSILETVLNRMFYLMKNNKLNHISLVYFAKCLDTELERASWDKEVHESDSQRAIRKKKESADSIAAMNRLERGIVIHQSNPQSSNKHSGHAEKPLTEMERNHIISKNAMDERLERESYRNITDISQMDRMQRYQYDQDLKNKDKNMQNQHPFTRHLSDKVGAIVNLDKTTKSDTEQHDQMSKDEIIAKLKTIKTDNAFIKNMRDYSIKNPHSNIALSTLKRYCKINVFKPKGGEDNESLVKKLTI